MIADISVLERRIEEKYNAARKKLRAQKRTPFTVLLALAIMITGTLGGYLTLSQAATATRRAPLVFQGRITDANYVPLADTLSRKMLFRIWSSTDTSAASDGGGTCAWSTGNSDGGTTNTAGEGLTNCGLAGSSSTLTSTVGDTASVPVTITRGVFSVPLGDTSFDSNNRMPVMSQALDNQSSEVYYIEIFVQNDSGTYERLSPRVRIGAASYAYNADELDGLNSTSYLRSDAFSGSPTTFTQINDADGITASDTTITVDSTSGYPALGGTLFIENEIVTYTGTTSTTFTGISRGQHGTTAAIHSDNILVSNYLTIGARSATLPASITAAEQRAFVINAPTYTGSSTTISTAATLAIEGPPQEGSGMTMSGRTPLWIRGANHTWGSLLFISYPSTTTMPSDGNDPNWVLGVTTNLSGLTASGSTTASTGSIVTGQLIDGAFTTLPTVTASLASGAVTLHGLRIASNTLDATGSGSVVDWYGARITMPNLGSGSTVGTITSRGMYIESSATITSGTTYALVTDRAAGNVGFGDTTPDRALEISRATANTTTLALSAANITHAMTSIQDTDMFFQVSSLETESGSGGALLTGISDSFPSTGMRIMGIIGPIGVNPTDTVPALHLTGAKGAASGTDRTTLDATETVLQISNNNTALATFLGNGNVGIGTTTPTSFLTITQPNASSGSPTALTITGGTHTALTAATEASDVNFNLSHSVQFTTGSTITNQRAFLIQAPTYDATAAGQVITNAATLTVLNAPIIGSTNIALTNSSALWLQGNSSMTRGRFLKMSYPASTSVTQNGALFGLDLDLNPTGGITFTTGANSVIGAEINMPIVATAQAATGATHVGVNINSAGWESISGTNTWRGVAIDMPDITQSGTSELTSTGLYIGGGTVVSGTSYALVTTSTAGNVGIGTTTPNERLDVAGSIGVQRTGTSASSYTALATDYYIGVTGTGANQTINLPTAASITGRVYIIKDEAGDAATNNITIDGSAAETIDGAATAVINANYGFRAILSDGANWMIIGRE